MKILLNFRAFPVAMGRWFEWALKDLGHKVLVAGPTMGDEVPWPNGPHHFPRYNFPPDIQLPDGPEYPLQKVLERINGVPDIIIQAGDVCYLSGPPGVAVRNVILATDPHCIDYTPRLTHATHFACMQDYYARKYARPYIWIPYGFYPPVHKKLSNLAKIYDVVFCGLMYRQREEFLNRAREMGLRVFSKLGVIYEDYVRIYNQGVIAFNHSSQLDLPARFWEGLAMGNLVLTNRIPELDLIDEKFGIRDGVHYVAYNTIDEALYKAQYYVSHPVEATKISEAGWQKVHEGHDYLSRSRELIEKVWKVQAQLH